MKLIFENWRKHLNEAELQYSQRAADEMYKFVVEYVKARSEGVQSKSIDIQMDEIFYDDNKKIKSGAIMLMFLQGNRGSKPEDIKFISKNWDNSSGFLKADQFFLAENSAIEFGFFIDPKLDGMGMLRKAEKYILIKINPLKHNSVQEIKSTIRHELQHVTQVLNGVALNYGKQLFANNGDVSKVKKVAFNNQLMTFGIGKEKTGLRQVSREKARALGITDNERIKRYLGDDFEYETWMSDLLDSYVGWIQSLPWSSPKLRSLESLSRHELAVKFTKDLLTNKEILQAFSEAMGASYSTAIKMLLKLRPKEFAKDFLKNLELRLQKMGMGSKE